MPNAILLNESGQKASARPIHGDGEMAGRVRAYDWSGTPLGPLEDWSDSLLAAVNMMLASSNTFALYCGEEGILLYNDAYRPLLHDKHPQALGMRGDAVWQEAWRVIGPQIEAAYRRGETARVAEALIPTEAGTELREGWYSYSFHPIFGGQDIIGVANPGQDDTEAVIARRALQQSEARLQQVLSVTNDAVVGVGRDWKVSYLNGAAKILYAQGRELVGEDVGACFPETHDEGSPFLTNMKRAMAGETVSYEAHYPDPLDLWIRSEHYPAPDGVVTFSRDITERKRAEKGLIQTEKLAAVGRLAASIAHEINNPLEAVTNLLYLAQRAQDASEVQAYLIEAERELRRVSVISTQTLRFHKQSTKPSEVGCALLFESVLSIYQGRLLNSHISVEKRKRAHRKVVCFEGEIGQVLNNLVGNAIDAMHPHGGRLLIRSREATNWTTGEKGVTLTVADTGTGIPPLILSKVFDAFYTTKGIGGTGLGLWVSKEIVERHRGTLTIRSSQAEIHHGTVFSMFLPFNAAVR